MAFPTSVNDQITDSVISTTSAGGIDTSSLAENYATLTQLVNELHNQTTIAQHNLAILHAALTQAGVPLDSPTTTVAMATVNSQVTDDLTQPNVKVLGDAPAMAMGDLFTATSQALANAAHNAVNAQQQSYVTMQQATTQGITTLYAIDTASNGGSTRPISG